MRDFLNQMKRLLLTSRFVTWYRVTSRGVVMTSRGVVMTSHGVVMTSRGVVMTSRGVET